MERGENNQRNNSKIFHRTVEIECPKWKAMINIYKYTIHKYVHICANIYKIYLKIFKLI